MYVQAIFECILYCCQQGISLRGHRESIDLDNLQINVGNFRSLVVLQSRSNEILKQKLMTGPKNGTWLGHDMQNTIIDFLADTVRSI